MLEKPRLKKAEPIVNDVIEEKLSSFRVELLEKFPSQTEGIDVERMKTFFRDRDLRTADITFLPEEQQPYFSEAVRGVSLKHSYEDSAAIYLPEIDLASAIRSKKKETLNGTFITEMLGVHELAHSTSRYRNFNYSINPKETEIHLPRSGFQMETSERGWGFFLEEAFADHMRSKYAAAYMPKDLWDKISNKIKQKASVDTLGQNSFVRTNSSHGDLYLPATYFYLDSEGDFNVHTSAYAGAGIDMIADKHPEIEEILIKARGSVDGLRKVAKMINDLQPGLYTTLQGLQYNLDDFKRGNALIAKAVGFTIE